MDYPGDASVITRVLKSGREGGRRVRVTGKCYYEKKVQIGATLLSLKMEEESHEPMNVGGL